MATAQLTASSRSATGKSVARTLRREGKVPGVIYGPAREPQALSINAREFERLLERIAAENTVIELSLDGATSPTLIRDIPRDAIRRTVLHVDFQELVAGEKVTVYIPIVLTGIPAGVRNAAGILSQVMQELSCLVDPLNMPGHIAVDVTEVTIGHSVHVGDITVPEGVEVLEDAEATVAVVAAPKTVEEPVATEEPEAAAEPELIRKAKDDEEEGEEEEEK